MYDWDDAVEETRRELGYYEGDYIEDWAWFMDKVRETFDYYKEEEYMDFCEESHHKYRDYLKSDRWKKLRKIILFRDYHNCQDCDNRATEVHHLNYDVLETEEEEKFCISLCRICHKKRHGIGVKE